MSVNSGSLDVLLASMPPTCPHQSSDQSDGPLVFTPRILIFQVCKRSYSPLPQCMKRALATVSRPLPCSVPLSPALSSSVSLPSLDSAFSAICSILSCGEPALFCNSILNAVNDSLFFPPMHVWLTVRRYLATSGRCSSLRISDPELAFAA